MKDQTFSQKLIDWYTGTKRELPWRKTKDPYLIWLSEVVLQQTRVAQGMPYWERFKEVFPTVHDLAAADETQVLRLWQGLGYYSRARNLHFTAKYISEQLNGVFPDSFKEILKLRGIGPYTAAAIASICFNEPVPVVDGNVFRFASRYFGIEKDISKVSTRRIFEHLLSEEISKTDPGTFNQAMMEYGATVCTPAPLCDRCVFQSICFAFRHKAQSRLPIKKSKTKSTTRYFHYVVLRHGDDFFLKRRTEKDVWRGLYDFLLLEGGLNTEEVMGYVLKELQIRKPVLEDESYIFKHILSHQKILAKFYTISVSDQDREELMEKAQIQPYSKEEVLTLPKPKLIVNYLHQNGIS